MKVTWIGHSCFLLASGGGTLLTDPYDAGSYPGTLLYHQVDLSPDFVTVSHSHADHAGVRFLGGSPHVFDAPGEFEAGPFHIRGVATHHDGAGGSQRGGNIVFVIEAGGVTVAHLGDLGHKLAPHQAAAVGSVDVLLIPVGGFFTIDAATATEIWQQLGPPPLTIPMHYRNEKCRFDIDTADPFLDRKPAVERPGASEISLKKENFPAKPKIVVLDSAY
ncbi:MAG: MBL fold metallo-hydrolase [Actinobacteria bacterium]|nr:MBL fold metallo-hydrolase [Actinomycetota bacterium]